MSWTVEQVLSLAPDASSAKAGRDLGVRRKWLAVARGEDLVWGECQGSGARPYRTAIDLSGPAYSCTCPSRKFPCKHALGLLLLVATEQANIPEQQPAEWASTWLTSRRARAERAATPTAIDPERAALDQRKRAERREQRVRAGVEDLERWLADIVRAGLADMSSRRRATFAQIHARLMDAQSPGLARLVGELADLPYAHKNWPERLLVGLGRLELLLEAYRRIERLEPGQAADVRSLVGFATAREEVLAEPSVRDIWSVLGRRQHENDRIRVQRTWLWGQTWQRWALLLDFAAAGQPFDQRLLPGTCIDAEVCFYPSALPMRALLKTEPRLLGSRVEARAQSVADYLDDYARGLGRNPWLERMPTVLGPAVPRLIDDRWFLLDQSGVRLPLGVAADTGWRLLAISGGLPISVMGEWDGYAVWPLGVVHDGAFIALRDTYSEPAAA